MFRFRVLEGLHQDTDPTTGQERTYARGQEFVTVADLRNQIPAAGGMTPKFEFLGVVAEPRGGPKLTPSPAPGTKGAQPQGAVKSGPSSQPAAHQVAAAAAVPTTVTHPEQHSAEQEQHKIAEAMGEGPEDQKAKEEAHAKQQEKTAKQEEKEAKAAEHKDAHKDAHHKPATHAHPHKKPGH